MFAVGLYYITRLATRVSPTSTHRYDAESFDAALDVSEPLLDDLLRSKSNDDDIVETSSSNSSTDEERFLDPMRNSKDVRGVLENSLMILSLI